MNASVNKQPYPILIVHGLLDCSMSWFMHAEKYQKNQILDKNVYLIF